MPKVTQVTLCPRCRSTISMKEDSCRCGFRFQFPLASEYVRPDYIYFQKFKVKQSPDEWFKNCPHEAQVAAMEDALRTLEYLLASKPPREGHLVKITTIGKHIGRLSQAIENYSHEGGHIEFTNPKPSTEDPLEAP